MLMIWHVTVSLNRGLPLHLENCYWLRAKHSLTTVWHPKTSEHSRIRKYRQRAGSLQTQPYTHCGLKVMTAWDYSGINFYIVFSKILVILPLVRFQKNPSWSYKFSRESQPHNKQIWMVLMLILMVNKGMVCIQYSKADPAAEDGYNGQTVKHHVTLSRSQRGLECLACRGPVF